MQTWGSGDRITALGAAVLRQTMEGYFFAKPAEVIAKLDFGNLGNERRSAYYQCLSALLRQATTCLWKQEIWDAATARSEVFREQPLQIEGEGDAQFWLWDTGPRIADPQLQAVFRLDRPCWLTAVMIVRGHKEIRALKGRPGAVLVLFFYPAAPQITGLDDLIPRVRAFPALAAGDPCIPAAAPFFAALEFMRQPFVGVEAEHIERHERKRFEKKHGRVPVVQTVLIRRAERQGSASEHTGARDYGCQWLVNGHWRKAHQRMKEQRPVYVQPYVKGPDNKPFKPPRTRVLVVGR